ncbi:MAG: recombinase family protein, partial [Chloroflexota bacterium]
ELAAGPKDAAKRILELDELGARVVSLDMEGVDPLDEALAQWRQLRSRDKLSDRALDSLRNKAMRGFGLGKTPYGYCIGESGRLEIVKQEAAVVERIYGMYLERDMGLRLIARGLNEAGTPTRRGSRWSVVTVRDILKNRAYTGTYIRFGVRVPGSHAPIINADLFRLAQKKREGSGGGRPPGRETVFSLSGLAHCGYCGGHMIGVSRTQSWSRKRDGGRTETEYRYYRCGSRVNQSVCSYHTQRADLLEQQVLALMDQRLKEPVTLQERPSNSDTSAALKSRIRSLDGRFQRYLDGVVKGTLPLEKLKPATVPLIRETRRLENRLSVIERQPDHGAQQEAWWQQLRGTNADLQEQWRQLSPADRRLYLGDLVEKIVVYDDHAELVLNG